MCSCIISVVDRAVRVFCVMARSCLVNWYRHAEEFSATTLKMEAANCSEMSETNYLKIRCHIQQQAVLTTRHAAIQHAVLCAAVVWLWKLVSSAVCVCVCVSATAATCDHDYAFFK